MAIATESALVLQDSAGNVYLFDHAAFDRARVTDRTLKAQLLQQLAAAAGEVHGYGLVAPPIFGQPLGGLPTLVGGMLAPLAPADGVALRPAVTKHDVRTVALKGKA